MAVWSSNTFCSLASTSSLRAWELLSSWDICSSKACKRKKNRFKNVARYRNSKHALIQIPCEEINTWICDPSCSIILCCFSITCKEKKWALKQHQLKHQWGVTDQRVLDIFHVIDLTCTHEHSKFSTHCREHAVNHIIQSFPREILTSL